MLLVLVLVLLLLLLLLLLPRTVSVQARKPLKTPLHWLVHTVKTHTGEGSALPPRRYHASTSSGTRNAGSTQHTSANNPSFRRSM